MDKDLLWTGPSDTATDSRADNDPRLLRRFLREIDRDDRAGRGRQQIGKPLHRLSPIHLNIHDHMAGHISRRNEGMHSPIDICPVFDGRNRHGSIVCPMQVVHNSCGDRLARVVFIETVRRRWVHLEAIIRAVGRSFEVNAAQGERQLL